MGKETVRIVTDERTKEGTCFLSMGWGHGTIIESREQALGVAKALIDHYSIKQDELYPWIACNDRMPEIGDTILIGWKVGGESIIHDGTVIYGDKTQILGSLFNFVTEKLGSWTHWCHVQKL